MIEIYSTNVEFLESMTGDITVALCLLSVAEIVYIIEQIGTGTLLIINNYLLGLIWGSDSMYFFDAHSKNENGNLLSSGTTVQSVYYNAYPLTLYFQVNRSVHCQCQKLERMSANQQRRLNAKKVNILIFQKKKKYSQVKGDMARTKSS